MTTNYRNPRASSWRTADDTAPRAPIVRRVVPADIPPELASLVLSLARVIVRMEPARAEVAVRALEAMRAEPVTARGVEAKTK